MFFESNSHAVRFLEALEYTEGRVTRKVQKRNYCALSYRRRAENTVFCYAGRELSLESGDLLFCPFSTEYVRRTDCDEVTVVHFEVFDGRFFEFEKFTPEEPQKYAALFDELLRTYENGAPERHLMCSALLYRILGEICRDMAGRRVPGERMRRLAPALSYLARSFCDPSLSVSYLASLCGMSEVYFRKLFREELQLSPRSYITKLRMAKAAAMLRSSYCSVAEIAEQVGYGDAKYFTAVFHKTMGVPPSRFLGE